MHPYTPQRAHARSQRACFAACRPATSSQRVLGRASRISPSTTSRSRASSRPAAVPAAGPRPVQVRVTHLMHLLSSRHVLGVCFAKTDRHVLIGCCAQGVCFTRFAVWLASPPGVAAGTRGVPVEDWDVVRARSSVVDEVLGLHWV